MSQDSLSRQQFSDHIKELHPKIKRRSTADKQKEHVREHWRFYTSHIHNEPGVGGMGNASKRPRGWYTGEDVEMRKR